MTTAVAPLPLATRHRLLIALGALFPSPWWGALTLVDLMSHQHEDVHLSFAVPSSQIRIRLSSGSVRIVPSTGSTVEVDRHLSWGLTHPHVKEKVKGGVLEINSGCSGFVNTYCTTRYDLAVPRAFALQIKSQDGSVTVIGVDGPLDLSSSKRQHRRRQLGLDGCSGGTGASRSRQVDQFPSVPSDFGTDPLAEQGRDLAGVGVTAQVGFGEDQFVVERHLEPPLR